jgi:hypothetical protein
MSDYSMSAWNLAVKLYDKSDAVGVPLHTRPLSLRSAWLKTAQNLIATGMAPMEDTAGGTAHRS